MLSCQVQHFQSLPTALQLRAPPNTTGRESVAGEGCNQVLRAECIARVKLPVTTRPQLRVQQGVLNEVCTRKVAKILSRTAAACEARCSSVASQRRIGHPYGCSLPYGGSLSSFKSFWRALDPRRPIAVSAREALTTRTIE